MSKPMRLRLLKRLHTGQKAGEWRTLAALTDRASFRMPAFHALARDGCCHQLLVEPRPRHRSFQRASLAQTGQSSVSVRRAKGPLESRGDISRQKTGGKCQTYVMDVAMPRQANIITGDLCETQDHGGISKRLDRSNAGRARMEYQ
jgi:hypothetical protein